MAMISNLACGKRTLVFCLDINGSRFFFQFLQKVKKTVEYCVVFHGDLLKNRHIDIVSNTYIVGLVVILHIMWYVNDRHVRLAAGYGKVYFCICVQVIMCSVYAVSKVMEPESQNNQEMTFRNIIRVYKQLPHDSDEVLIIIMCLHYNLFKAYWQQPV